MAVAALPPTAGLPRRDPDARNRLAAAARRGAPVVLAGERRLPVPDPLGAELPGRGLQRGTVTVVEGEPGAGGTSVGLALAAAATAAGEWVAAVDPDGTLGGLAVAAAGVALERFARVPRVPADRWATVVAALLDGAGLVLADPPPAGVRASDARRLVGRVRERGALLVVTGPWPAEAALRVQVRGDAWPGLGPGLGVLAPRVLHAEVSGRALGGRSRAVALAVAG